MEPASQAASDALFLRKAAAQKSKLQHYRSALCTDGFTASADFL